MNDDDQNMNNDDANVIPEGSEESQDKPEIASPASGEPRNDETNLPVEEAGLLEEPKESQESEGHEESKSQSEDAKVDEEQEDSDSTQTMSGDDSNSPVASDDSADLTPDESQSTTETSESTSDETPSDTPDTDTPTDRPTDIPSQDTPGRWYVVHTYSGHENKVATTLKQRIESEHLQDKIFEVLVPTQDKIEIRGGKKASIKEKIFPGYILVKMILDDISWLAVRTTQGVTSFVGMGNKPTPISEEEVKTIVKFTQIAEPTFKQIFTVNDTVKIVDGPFAEFIGKVDSVDEEKGKVRVLVSIFGRETPVELDFLQVQKI